MSGPHSVAGWQSLLQPVLGVSQGSCVVCSTSLSRVGQGRGLSRRFWRGAPSTPRVTRTSFPSAKGQWGKGWGGRKEPRVGLSGRCRDPPSHGTRGPSLPNSLKGTQVGSPCFWSAQDGLVFLFSYLKE